MGMNTQQSGGGRRYRPMAEINITPFVDVMLVLLIIFMVSAPLMSVGVPVDLPSSQAKGVAQSEQPIIITVDENGDLYLSESRVSRAQLITTLSELTGDNRQKRIFIRGDQALAYGQVMDVMGAITAAGYSKVALVTETGQ
jgi:biopolymer transport protein TolR